MAKTTISKMKIKKGDLVQVISGRSQKNGGDRGKQGKVIQVLREEQRVIVEGVNRIKRHTKVVNQGGRAGTTGGIISQEAPVHVSNVAVVDPETKSPTRVRIRVDMVERDGRQKAMRTRVAVRSGKDL